MPCDWEKGTPMPDWFQKLDVKGVEQFLARMEYFDAEAV